MVAAPLSHKFEKQNKPIIGGGGVLKEQPIFDFNVSSSDESDEEEYNKLME